jgi:HK97 family phage prohead protease
MAINEWRNNTTTEGITITLADPYVGEEPRPDYKPDAERRIMPVGELRVEGDDESRKIVGYAAVFNQLSSELWGFREKIAPGAFGKTIQESDVRALFNHDPNFVLGRSKAGTLDLAEDEIGLAIEIEPPDTQFANDLITSIDRGDVTQMSFGFRTITDEWQTVEEEQIRTLKEVELFDVSPVTFPAYPQTTVGLRSLGGADLGEFTAAIVRLDKGTATTADLTMIRGFVDSTNEVLDAAPAEGGHDADNQGGAEDSASHKHAARRRKLEILKLEGNNDGK